MKFLSRNYRLILFLAIPLISILMHSRVFTMDLVGIHVWRQTQTQSQINNFYEEDFNILDPRINYRGEGDGIIRMELPVFQWMIAASYNVFGNDISVTRVFVFIIGLFAVWGMFYLVNGIFDDRLMALIAAWCFTFSPVFFYYTVNPIPDTLALSASIWGLAFFFMWIKSRRWMSIALSAFFLCLGTLAKLPFILFTIVPAAWFIKQLFSNSASDKREILAAIAICITIFLPAIAWYAWVVPGWTGNGVLKGVLGSSTEELQELFDILLSNIVSTLPEMLINYAACLFFVMGCYWIIKRKLYRHKLFYMFALWGVMVILYFLYELNMISTVHDYYMFPFLPPIFVIVAYGVANMLQLSKAARVFAFILLLALPLTAFLRIDTRWNEASPGFNVDLLKYKNELRAAVPDSSLCIVGNDYSQNIFFYYIHKKGWTFDSDQLDAERLKLMISKGARYLYSDSRVIEEAPGIKQMLGPPVKQIGSIRIFSLSADSFLNNQKLSGLPSVNAEVTGK